MQQQCSVDVDIPTGQPSRKTWWLGLLVVSAVSAGLLFSRLDGSLSAWDEPVYASVAKRSLQYGNYLFPSFDDGGRADKPALYFWLIMAAYELLGVSVWATRLPSILGALGCVMLVYLIGSRWFSFRVGLIAALLLATSRFFLTLPRNSLLDPLMLFFQLGFVWCATRHTETRTRHLILGAGMLGLAFFLKQWLGLSVVVPVIVYWVIGQTYPRADLRMWLAAAVVFLVVGCGWYVTAWCFDSEYVRWLLFEYNLTDRFQSSGNPDHWFWPRLMVDSGWQGWHAIRYLYPLAWGWIIVEWFRTRSARSLILGAWVWSLGIALQLVQFHAPQYLLGLYPVTCLIFALMLEKMWNRDWNGLDWLAVCWAAAMVSSLVWSRWLVSWLGPQHLGICLLIGLGWGAGVLFMPTSWNRLRSSMALGLTLLILGIGFDVPRRADWAPEIRQAVETFHQHAGGQGTLYSSFEVICHCSFYHDGLVTLVERDDSDHLQLPAGEIYLMALTQDRAQLGDRASVLADAGPYSLFRLQSSAD